MGHKIRVGYCQNSSSEKAANSRVVEDAFSGHCFAMPCQVRDETYIKIKGKWHYFYRAVDKHGKTLDFMLSKRRNKAAAKLFFKYAIAGNGVPDRVVIDKSGSNLAGHQYINLGLKFSRSHRPIEILRIKYLNNIVEQDHRFIKKLTRPMMGFKAFHSAVATLVGVEVAHMIRKQQFLSNSASPFE